MEECEESSNRKRAACRKPRREMHVEEGEQEAEEDSGGRNETDLEDFVTRALAVNTIRSQSKNKKPRATRWSCLNKRQTTTTTTTFRGCNMERRET